MSSCNSVATWSTHGVTVPYVRCGDKNQQTALRCFLCCYLRNFGFYIFWVNTVFYQAPLTCGVQSEVANLQHVPGLGQLQFSDLAFWDVSNGSSIAAGLVQLSACHEVLWNCCLSSGCRWSPRPAVCSQVLHTEAPFAGWCHHSMMWWLVNSELERMWRAVSVAAVAWRNWKGCGGQWAWQQLPEGTGKNHRKCQSEHLLADTSVRDLPTAHRPPSAARH